MGAKTDQNLRELKVAIIRNLIADDPMLMGDLLRYQQDYTFEDNARNIPHVGWILANTGVAIPDDILSEGDLLGNDDDGWYIPLTLIEGVIPIGIRIDFDGGELGGGTTESLGVIYKDGQLKGFTNPAGVTQVITVKYQ